MVKDDLILQSDIEAYGLVYAEHWLQIEKYNQSASPFDASITGGLVGFNVRIQPPAGSAVAITYDQSAVSTPLDPDFNTDAPLVQVGHWEEEY